MAEIRVLSYRVGESDVIQPGEITNLVWDFSDILVDAEEIQSVSATAANSAGEVVANVIADASVIGGVKTNSAASIRIHNLVDGERYKIKITATVVVGEKVATAVVFVPVVAP